jgi:LacI family transcriptional regulator
VLNNSQNVKNSTRLKVKEAIRQLDFTPDPIARSMILGKTSTIAVAVSFLTNPVTIEILRGIEAATHQREYELLVYNLETEEQREDYLARLPMIRKVDGLLLVSVVPDEKAMQRLHKTNLPAVLVDSYNPGLTSVVVNNRDGGYRGARHLLDLGHTRIGFINGKNPNNFGTKQFCDRLAGVRQAYAEAGLDLEADLIETTGWERECGGLAAARLLSLAKPPTAILAASDIQAIGALEHCRAMQMNVPKDISIMGFDGAKISEWLKLTTVQQPLYRLGEIGLNKLLEVIENPAKEVELICLDTTLTLRQSTARPPK